MQLGLRRCVFALLAAICVAGHSAEQEKGVNLLANGDFEAGPGQWKSSFGQAPPAIADVGDRAHSGRFCARLNVTDAIVGIDAPKLHVGREIHSHAAYEVSACLRNDGVIKGGFGLRLYCYDVNGQFVKMLGGISITTTTPRHDWKTYRAAFGRGTSQRLPARTATLLVRFSLWGKGNNATGDVWIDDVALRLTRTAGSAKRERPVAWIWHDDALAPDSRAHILDLDALLRETGYDVARLTTAEFAKTRKPTTEHVDLLVMPYGPLYPGPAAQALREFWEDGGDMLTFGDTPVGEPLLEVNGRWERLRSAGAVCWQTDAKTEWPFSHHAETDAMKVTPKPDGTVAFEVADLSSYCYAGTAPSALPEAGAVLCFSARSLGDTPMLCLELLELDGSRWKAAVELGSEWQEYRVHTAGFCSYATPERATKGDAVRPDQVERLLFGFTKTMVGSGRKGFEIRELRACAATVPQATALTTPLFLSPHIHPGRWFGEQLMAPNTIPGPGVSLGAPQPVDALATPPETPFVAQQRKTVKLRARPVRGWRHDLLKATKPAKKDWTRALRKDGGTTTIPLLRGTQPSGDDIPAGSLCVHSVGELAGGVWGVFGVPLQSLSGPGGAPLREAVRAAAVFAARGCLVRGLKPTFETREDATRMTVHLDATNMSSRPLRLQFRSTITWADQTAATQSWTTVTIPPFPNQPIEILSIPRIPRDWQRFAVSATIESADTPVHGSATLTLDTRKALRDISDFFVDSARETRQFSKISFVDNRAARGLLGAFEVFAEEAYRDAALAWGETMIEQQRPDGGYRMGYGITKRGEECYVADGGEIAVGMARLIDYAPPADRPRFVESVKRYFEYRESFRVATGGIGVGWCLTDYGQRPLTRLDKPTRIFAPERNTYTIGCSLAAAYLFAAMTNDVAAEKQAEADADWLMPRAKRLNGAFCESFFFAHHFAHPPERKRFYANYLQRIFADAMRTNDSAWWLGGGGRSALNLDGLIYCQERLEGIPTLTPRIITATCAMFSPEAPHSFYRVMQRPKPTLNEWIYLCYGYLSLADVVKPMVSMDKVTKRQ